MLLPVCIHFSPFKLISYTSLMFIKDAIQRELIDYAYLTFFPLLIAGPNTALKYCSHRFRHRYHVNENLVHKGLWLINCGLIKKALIADYIAQYNNIVFDTPAKPKWLW